MSESTLTERGQVSVPAGLRKKMRLAPGQRLRWEQISDREIRISIPPAIPAGPEAALGFVHRQSPRPAKRTAAWMREIREGEA